MNESALAPVRPPAPRWESVAAGVLAVWWVGWVFGWGGGVAEWWFRILISLQRVTGLWQSVLAGGDWQWVVRPGSEEFADGVWMASRLFWEGGMPALIVAAWWVASGGELRRMRGVFWVAVLGHGVLGLGWLAVAGRLSYLDPTSLTGPPYRRKMWFGGWLDRIFDFDQARDAVTWTGCVFAIALASTILWLRRQQQSRAKAGNALATGSAEGAGSRA